MSKKCPFRLANPFDPTDGSWYWVTTDAYGGPGGATGDGVNDDRSAIQTCINAAAAAGKEVYFPAGTYRMAPSGGACLLIPANVILQGVGAASVLEVYDNGTDQQPVGLYINDKSNITIKDLKITGTVTAGTSYPSQYPSAQAITVNTGANGLTVQGVTFDKCEYAIKFQDYTGASSSNVVFDSCTTLSSVMNPFFVARVEDFRVTGGYYAAATVGQQAGRWPHHFYLATACTNVLIMDCTLTGGQHAWTTSEPAAGESIVFRNIALGDIYQGAWDTSTEGSLLYDGITLVATARSKADESWFTFGGSGSIEVRDFDITCAPGRGQYLVADYGATVNFRNGIIRNCAGLGATPPGAYVEGGQVIYEHVTVE